MASYHLQIADDNLGTNAWTFLVNPDDFSGMFPPRTYTRLGILGGSALKQFPEHDTRIRRLKFDVIPDTTTPHSAFLMGDSEEDTDSLLYLKKLDADGQLAVYWLGIPEALTKRLRPYGFRETDWIPIRVLDVLPGPERKGGAPWWNAEMVFEIVPYFETTAEFGMGVSELGSENLLGTSELDYVYTHDDTGGTYTDRTSEAWAGGTPFPSFAVATSDEIIMLSQTPFYGVKIWMDTLETVVPDTNQGKTAHVWYYYNGITWATINSVSSVNDGSESFTKDARTVTWGELANNTAGALSTLVPGETDNTLVYAVKVVIGSVTTSFKFDMIWRN